MANKKKQDWIPLNEAITDFIEIKNTHYNTQIPTFTLLAVRRFVKFDGSKITVKSVSHYNMNEDYIPVITYGSAICDPDNIYTKGFGIDLAFRKASEKMERECKKLLIAYSKEHMLRKIPSTHFEKCSKIFNLENFKLTVPKGHRNNMLFERAKVYKYKHVSRNYALELLKVFNKVYCLPPIPEIAVEEIINAAYYKSKHEKNEERGKHGN